MRRANKYGAVKTTVEGITFDSGAEARRYQQLRLLERAGEISDLERQVSYRIDINGVHVCNVRPDFRYRDNRAGKVVVEDVKGGPATAVFRLKQKLVLAAHGITVVEVRP